MAQSKAPLVLVAVCGLLAGGAALAAYGEAAPYIHSGPTAQAKFDALALDELPIGPSVDAKKLVLDDCLLAIRSIYGKAQSTVRRGQVLGHCRALTARITRQAPSYAYGWFVSAAVAEAQGDGAALQRALQQSYLTGPNEQWIAELRADLAERNYAELDARSRQLHEADLALLVRSWRGVGTIAKRYVEEPEFRTRITAVAERLPAQTQRLFLGYVQQAAKEYSERGL